MNAPRCDLYSNVQPSRLKYRVLGCARHCVHHALGFTKNAKESSSPQSRVLEHDRQSWALKDAPRVSELS